MNSTLAPNATGAATNGSAGSARCLPPPPTPPPRLPDNSHIVIPLMSFVFGFPIFVIALLCVIQRRNKHLQKREAERLQNRRLSTISTVYTGLPSSSARAKSSCVLAAVDERRGKAMAAVSRYLRVAAYSHRDSLHVNKSRRSVSQQMGRVSSFHCLELEEAVPDADCLTVQLVNKSASAQNLAKFP